MFEGLKLRKIRLAEQGALNDSNLCLYKHITEYIKATDLTYYEKEEALQQIMDMLLQAQIENRSKAYVVGDDYKEFCKEICREYRSDKSRSYIILDYLGKYLFWIILAFVAHMITNRLKGLEVLKITINQIFFSNYFAIVLTFISKASQRRNIHIPIDNKHRFAFNPYSLYNRIDIIFFIISVVIGIILPIIVQRLFNVDVYTYSIEAVATLSMVTFMLIALLSVQIYKFMYHKKL